MIKFNDLKEFLKPLLYRKKESCYSLNFEN